MPHPYYDRSRFQVRFRSLFIISILLAVGALGVNLADQAIVREVDATVVSVHQIPTMGHGKDFYMRYLVLTDKETFICAPSFLNVKFNNSDIFFRLKEGQRYHFRVSGFGKGMLTDYRNILSAEPF